MEMKLPSDADDLKSRIGAGYYSKAMQTTNDAIALIDKIIGAESDAATCQEGLESGPSTQPCSAQPKSEGKSVYQYLVSVDIPAGHVQRLVDAYETDVVGEGFDILGSGVPQQVRLTKKLGNVTEQAYCDDDFDCTRQMCVGIKGAEANAQETYAIIRSPITPACILSCTTVGGSIDGVASGVSKEFFSSYDDVDDNIHRSPAESLDLDDRTSPHDTRSGSHIGSEGEDCCEGDRMVTYAPQVSLCHGKFNVPERLQKIAHLSQSQPTTDDPTRLRLTGLTSCSNRRGGWSGLAAVTLASSFAGALAILLLIGAAGGGLLAAVTARHSLYCHRSAAALPIHPTPIDLQQTSRTWTSATSLVRHSPSPAFLDLPLVGALPMRYKRLLGAVVCNPLQASVWVMLNYAHEKGAGAWAMVDSAWDWFWEQNTSPEYRLLLHRAINPLYAENAGLSDRSERSDMEGISEIAILTDMVEIRSDKAYAGPSGDCAKDTAGEVLPLEDVRDRAALDPPPALLSVADRENEQEFEGQYVPVEDGVAEVLVVSQVLHPVGPTHECAEGARERQEREEYAGGSAGETTVEQDVEYTTAQVALRNYVPRATGCNGLCVSDSFGIRAVSWHEMVWGHTLSRRQQPHQSLPLPPVHELSSTHMEPRRSFPLHVFSGWRLLRGASKAFSRGRGNDGVASNGKGDMDFMSFRTAASSNRNNSIGGGSGNRIRGKWAGTVFAY